MATNQAVDKSSCLRKYFRSKYYHIMDVLTDIELPRNVNGFGLYDKSVVECLRRINDPYPFLRGLISELGFEVQLIPFNQTMRIKGISKTNYYSLFDIALLGIISHSNIPIRIASFLGILIGIISMLVGVLYFILKLFFWTSFPIGIAPIVIGTFFMFGLVLFFIGLIGEYVASIHTYVKNRPIVVEKERINF